MTSYQFSVCQLVNEQWTEVPGILTPSVTASTPNEAMNHPDNVKFMTDHLTYRFYRQVT